MRKRLSFSSLVHCFSLITVLLFGSLPLPASAMDIPFFMNNDILYYDPASGAECTSVGVNYSTPTDLPSLTGSDDDEKVWNFLVSSETGLSPEQAAGIMGVGYGLDQWTGSRLDAFEEAAEEK